MAKNKGRLPASDYTRKEPEQLPKLCRYCGCELAMQGYSEFCNPSGSDDRVCVDCNGMFDMKLGFMEWEPDIPAEIIRKAEKAAERHPELLPKVQKWRKLYRV